MRLHTMESRRRPSRATHRRKDDRPRADHRSERALHALVDHPLHLRGTEQLDHAAHPREDSGLPALSRDHDYIRQWLLQTDREGNADISISRKPREKSG